MKFTFPPESKPLDGYTIKRGIHRGGFGEVYYALSDAGKEVALKLLQNNTDVELRGVRHCLNLKHPNLLTIFDIKQDSDEDHWIIMEYMSGQTMDTVVASGKEGLPKDVIRLWTDGIIAGLAFLHDRGIVHRDLKPANVYEDQGIVKIGDVGLSKFISQSRRGAQTQSVGTVYYMAPEVARGSYGREVDIYALGVMLYEMLTGDVPFDGETTGEILMKHLSERPDLRRVPAEFQTVIARSLEKDPVKRYATVEDFERDYRAAMDGEAPAAKIDRQPAKPEPLAEVEMAYPREQARQAPPRRVPPRRPVKNANAAAGAGGAAAGVATAATREFTFMERHGSALKALAVVAIVIAMFSERSIGGAASNWLVYAAILGVIYWFFQGRKNRQASVQKAASPSRRPTAVRHAVNHRARRAFAGERLTPETHRQISWSERAQELSGSLTVATIITVLITACLHTVTSFLPNLQAVGGFGFTTLAASWTILSVSKLQEGASLDRNSRRLVLLLAGLGVGAAAFTIDQFLLVDYATGSVNSGMIQSVGRHNLVDAGQPTIAGYMVFFGSLLGLRRWWWHADSFRTTRFKISTTLITLALAFILSCVFAFPQSWGMLWAVAISCVVQLSAIWTPPRSRVVQIPEAAAVA